MKLNIIDSQIGTSECVMIRDERKMKSDVSVKCEMLHTFDGEVRINLFGYRCGTSGLVTRKNNSGCN
jgi:hypothetical protein